MGGQKKDAQEIGQKIHAEKTEGNQEKKKCNESQGLERTSGQLC